MFVLRTYFCKLTHFLGIINIFPMEIDQHTIHVKKQFLHKQNIFRLLDYSLSFSLREESSIQNNTGCSLSRYSLAASTLNALFTFFT